MYASGNNNHMNYPSSSVSMYNFDLELPDTNESKLNSNQVDFISNKPINPIDLDLIITFLSNPKQSGGGQITEFSLEAKQRRLLMVNYESQLFKQRIIAKSILKFQSYYFLANAAESEQSVYYKPDNQVLILKNINGTEDLNLVKMFAETLILADNELNDVVNVQKSLFFKNTFYVRFKLDFDVNQCMRRLETRSTLRDRKVKLINAYETNTILIKLNQVSFEKLEQFAKKKYPQSPIASISLKGDWLLIKFISSETAKEFLNDKHKYDLFKNIQFEPMYNIEFVNDTNEDDDKNHQQNQPDNDYQFNTANTNVPNVPDNEDFDKAISQTDILNRNITYAKLLGDEEESLIGKSNNSLVNSVKLKFVSSILNKISRLKD